jgi:vacuolar protein sorting-associated protein 13A/C
VRYILVITLLFIFDQVDMLCGVMSDKEYLVIIDCASTNVSETPNIPPSFRDNATASEISSQEFLLLEPAQESDEQVAQGPGSHGQELSAWTKMRWNVDVRHVEIELYVGVDRDSPLARLEVLDTIYSSI